MEKNNIMLSIINENGQIDCPQDQSETYFETLKSCREKGIELLKRYDAKVFIARLLTTGNGHYRTLGYFNINNEYIR